MNVVQAKVVDLFITPIQAMIDCAAHCKSTYVCMYVQGGPAKVKPTYFQCYFTYQNAQTRYYSTVLFYKKNR